MLKGKQKKLDVNKDGKISGDDFAMLKNVRMQKKDAMGKKVVKAEKGKMVNGTGKYIDLPENIPSLLGESEKKLKLFKEYSKSIGKFSKKKMGGGMMQKPIMAEKGKMITEAEAPTLGGIMGAAAEAAAPAALDSDRLTEVDIANAERIARRRPLPMLGEEKEKPMTPKERREKDIAKRAKKKMGGGMMQDSMGYKKGGAVRGGRAEIKGLRPAKMF